MEIRENEHIDENGLPVCNNCGKPCYVINPNNNQAVRCLCKCEAEKLDAKMLEFSAQQRAITIASMRMNSLLGKRYKNATFENAEITQDNKKIYDKIKEYAKNYQQMLLKGNGFYIYGPCGVGKTHLLACLCNYLMDNLQECAFTNFMNIAEDIRACFNGKGDEEQVIAKYSHVKFLFIDDLGKESYKKLSQDASAGWLDEKIFEILNNRYNNMLPTIFSSNYSPQQIASEFGFDKATLDRIVEFSTIVFKMTGENRRYLGRQNDW